MTDYFVDFGHYPISTQGLSALISEPSTSPLPLIGVWRGPYLNKSLNNLSKDGLGRELSVSIE